MGKENLTPLNVQQELIHSYFLSSVYIIMPRFDEHDYGVQVYLPSDW